MTDADLATKRFQAMRERAMKHADCDWALARQRRTPLWFADGLVDLPSHINVQDGEEIQSAWPVLILSTERSGAQTLQDPVIQTLLSLDANTVLETLLFHDPLSWHCARRHSQANWWQQRPSVSPPRPCAIQREGAPWQVATTTTTVVAPVPLSITADVLTSQHRRRVVVPPRRGAGLKRKRHLESVEDILRTARPGSGGRSRSP